MNTQYLLSFVKNLKAPKSSPVFDPIKVLIFEKNPGYSSIESIRNLKKLKDAETVYRIRVGDYRIGFFIGDETITFARVLHRKNIYRYFPWLALEEIAIY